MNYSKFVFNTDRRTLAEKLVLYCGVPANLHGFDKLVDCAVVASHNPNASMNEIYRTVSVKYGIASNSVLRVIMYAIAKTPNFANAFSDVIGSHVQAQDVHCSMIVAHFGKIIDNPELSPLFDTDDRAFYFMRHAKNVISNK